MAPKAYLGSYKIFGSPGVNDGATDNVIVTALEDAINDGMDVVSASFGSPALTGPLDTGAACGNPAGVYCDISASAFELAAQKGMLIFAAAATRGRNQPAGLSDLQLHRLPGRAPSVIAVGGTSNSHGFLPGVKVSGSAVPSNLNLISAQPTDSYSPYGAYSDPLVDVGTACSALPASSLFASFALILRGSCNFSVKMQNAVNAGAAGVIFYDSPGDTSYPFSPTGLSNFTQPAVLISNADGVNLKAFIDANPGYSVTIDPASFEVPVTPYNQFVSYSSIGPALGTNAIKPDVLAPAGGGQNGDLIYMAAQSYDPLGEVYSSTGYIAAAGTSFATPLSAGAGALVKQAHPSYSAAQIKSALVNTATQDVIADDSGAATSILETGGGKIATDLAIETNVTVVPASLSFGALATGTLPATQTLQFTNTGSTPVSLSLAMVSTGTATAAASLRLDKSSLSLAPGASAGVNVTLSGTIPASGLYSGALTVTGGAVPLRVPYLFLVGSNVAAGFTIVEGDQQEGEVGQTLPYGGIAFQVTDANGVPVSGTAVNFAVGSGSVPMVLSQVSTTTDAYGYAYATCVGRIAGGQLRYRRLRGALQHPQFARIHLQRLYPRGLFHYAGRSG